MPELVRGSGAPAGPALVLPPDLAERARRVATGELAPVPTRAAATVALVRDAPAGGIEVYLLRRHAGMGFAAGMHVFPGGAVDPRDTDPAMGWAGPPPAAWASRLGCDEPTARASVCAAVRETFEECGVLLAGASADDVVRDTAAIDWEADRRAVLDRRVALSELLARRRLVLRSDLLRPWARWVTPRFERRRYDTTFYVAALPDAQAARDVSGEADAVAWVQPGEAVAAADSGALAMLPPTRDTLASLVAYGSVAEVLAAPATRSLQPHLPGWVDRGADVRLVLPAEPGWPGDDPGGAP